MHTKALSLTTGLVWGGAILLIATLNLLWPPYGRTFLEFAASIYPGFLPGSGPGSVIVGSFYGLIDGLIGGAIFAWLYNLLARRISAR